MTTFFRSWRGFADGSQGWNQRYALSFRDKMHDWNIDRIERQWGSKPPGWDDPEQYAPIQQAMDQYRQHLAFVYANFQYRYVDAAQRLETIAEDTQALCQRMYNDPLLSTAFSYAARTTPAQSP